MHCRTQIPLQMITKQRPIFSKTFSSPSLTPSPSADIESICTLINNHPFPLQPLQPSLQLYLPSLSTNFVEQVLGRLFSGHCNGLKAFEFFDFATKQPNFHISSDSFEKIVHILSRMRDFDKVWDLLERTHHNFPSLLTTKSLSILLSRYAKHTSFEETIEAFEKMGKFFGGFNTEAFNVLLRAFCTQGEMKEARAVFNKMFSRFSPNTQTLNILLLGFKESGNITAMELFYHEIIRRGCTPNNVSYNIRIDALCKKGRSREAIKLREEMEEKNCSPTVETFTTLIHGLGISHNPKLAQKVFDDMVSRGLNPDTGAYNALINAYMRVGDTKTGRKLLGEMEEKGVGFDNTTYHTMFWGMKNFGDMKGIYGLYKRMVENRWVPKMCTVVMLMKCFCYSDCYKMGLKLWNYLVEMGCCPHGHALDLLVMELCRKGKLEEAYECCRQVLDRGRLPKGQAFGVLQRHLSQEGEKEILGDLVDTMKRLESALPTSQEYILGSNDSST
ncbi:hypothetical protein AMTRI_Chr12g274830 [Amborella trichopoda]